MPIYVSLIEVQFESIEGKESDRLEQVNALANACWDADSHTNMDITGVRVQLPVERHMDYSPNHVELPGIEIVDPTGAPTCGCQEIGSPVSGILFVGEVGTEVQRCDTHAGGPRFESDFRAASYLENWGVKTEERDRGDGATGYFVTDLGDFEAGQSTIAPGGWQGGPEPAGDSALRD